MESSRFWYVEYADGKNTVFAFLDEKTKQEFEEYLKQYYNMNVIAKWYIWPNEKDNI